MFGRKRNLEAKKVCGQTLQLSFGGFTCTRKRTTNHDLGQRVERLVRGLKGVENSEGRHTFFDVLCDGRWSRMPDINFFARSEPVRYCDLSLNFWLTFGRMRGTALRGGGGLLFGFLAGDPRGGASLCHVPTMDPLRRHHQKTNCEPQAAGK